MSAVKTIRVLDTYYSEEDFLKNFYWEMYKG